MSKTKDMILQLSDAGIRPNAKNYERHELLRVYNETANDMIEKSGRDLRPDDVVDGTSFLVGSILGNFGQPVERDNNRKIKSTYNTLSDEYDMNRVNYMDFVAEDGAGAEQDATSEKSINKYVKLKGTAKEIAEKMYKSERAKLTDEQVMDEYMSSGASEVMSLEEYEAGKVDQIESSILDIDQSDYIPALMERNMASLGAIVSSRELIDITEAAFALRDGVASHKQKAILKRFNDFDREDRKYWYDRVDELTKSLENISQYVDIDKNVLNIDKFSPDRVTEALDYLGSRQGNMVLAEMLNKTGMDIVVPKGQLSRSLYTSALNIAGGTYAFIKMAGDLAYDVAAIPQNAVADLFNIDNLKTSSEAFRENHRQMANLIDKALPSDYTLGLAQEKSASKYFGKGIFEYLKDGENDQAMKLLGYQVLENLPQQLEIIGLSYLTGNPTLGTAVLSAQASGQAYYDTKDKPGMSKYQKYTNAVLKGLSEYVAERYVGTGKIAERALRKEAIKDGVSFFLKQTGLGIIDEMADESASQIAGNITDILTNNRDANGELPGIFDGVVDAALVAGVSGGIMGGGNASVRIVENYVASEKQKAPEEFTKEAVDMMQLKDMAGKTLTINKQKYKVDENGQLQLFAEAPQEMQDIKPEAREGIKIEKDAIEKYGKTDAPTEALYITTFGEFIDGTGKHEVSEDQRKFMKDRVVDHRDVAQEYSEESGTDALVDYMNKTNNIRMSLSNTDSPLVLDVVSMPNNSQLLAIQRAYKASNGQIDAEISDANGNSIASGSFNSYGEYKLFLENNFKNEAQEPKPAEVGEEVTPDKYYSSHGVSIPLSEMQEMGEPEIQEGYDVRGEKIPTPEEWSELSEEEKTARSKTITKEVTDSNGNTFKVDHNIAPYLQRLYKLGFHTGQSDSGTISDHPGHRFVSGENINQPILNQGYLTFWKPETVEGSSNTEEQINIIRQAAENTGWIAEDDEVFFQPSLSLRLQHTNDGTSHKDITEEANNRTDGIYPNLKENDFNEWLNKRDDEIMPQVIEEHGGLYQPSDSEVLNAWDNLVSEVERLSDHDLTEAEVPTKTLTEITPQQQKEQIAQKAVSGGIPQESIESVSAVEGSESEISEAASSITGIDAFKPGDGRMDDLTGDPISDMEKIDPSLTKRRVREVHYTKLRRDMGDKIAEAMMPGREYISFAPEVVYAIRNYERLLANDLKRHENDMNAYTKVFKHVHKTNKKLFELMDRYMMNSNTDGINNVIFNNELNEQSRLEIDGKEYTMRDVVSRWREMRDELYQFATSVGYDMSYLGDYFPRVVRDVNGYIDWIAEKIRQEEGEDSEYAYIMNDLARQSVEKNGKLTREEKAAIIENAMRGYMAKGNRLFTGRSSHAKTRKVADVTGESYKFYYDTPYAITHYVNELLKTLHTRKFFGQIAPDDQGMQDVLKSNSDLFKDNVEQSIGYVVDKVLYDRGLNSSERERIRKTLRGVFSPRGKGKFVGAVSSAAYMALLGPQTALKQIDDMMFTILSTDPKYAWSAMKNVLKGEAKLTIEDVIPDFNLYAKIFDETGNIGKAMEWYMSKVGIRFMDNLQKTILIEAKMLEAEDILKDGKAHYRIKPDMRSQDVVDMMHKIAGEAFEDFKDAVLNKDYQNDLVKSYAYNTVADMHPIGSLGQPVMRRRAGDFATLWDLKIFQFNMFAKWRENVFAEIKQAKEDGDTERYKVAARNAAIISAFFTMLSTSANILNALLYNRPIEPDEMLVDGFISSFLGNSYYVRGGFKGTHDWISRNLEPTAYSVPTDIIDMFINGTPEKAVKYIPAIGKLYDSWFGYHAKEHDTLLDQIGPISFPWEDYDVSAPTDTGVKRIQAKPAEVKRTQAKRTTAKPSK